MGGGECSWLCFLGFFFPFNKWNCLQLHSTSVLGYVVLPCALLRGGSEQVMLSWWLRAWGVVPSLWGFWLKTCFKKRILFPHSTSEATMKELVAEVMEEVLRQVAVTTFNAERERVKEERRRVEEERWAVAFAIWQGGLHPPLGTVRTAGTNLSVHAFTQALCLCQLLVLLSLCHSELPWDHSGCHFPILGNSVICWLVFCWPPGATVKIIDGIVWELLISWSFQRGRCFLALLYTWVFFFWGNCLSVAYWVRSSLNVTYD